MPRSSDPEVYPHTFFTILRRMKEILPLTINRPDMRDAQRMRFMWYDFRRALTKSKHPLEQDALRISVSTKANADGSANVEFSELGLGMANALQWAVEAKLGHALIIDEGLRNADEARAAAQFNPADFQSQPQRRKTSDETIMEALRSSEPPRSLDELMEDYVKKVPDGSD